MKKLILFLLLLTSPAFADWSITTSWTRSSGPDLASEQVLSSGVSKCTVIPPATTTCTWVEPTLNKTIVIRSFNSQGAYNDTVAVQVNNAPAPATGILINVTYVAP